MEDYSYLGSGKIRLREYGSAAPLVEVGNCSALTLSPQPDKKTLPNYTEPGGGTQSTVERLSGVEIAYTFHDFSPDNFARALRGTATPVVAGTAAAEAVVAYKGGFTPLAHIPTAITAVEPAGGGTAYVAGTDYNFVNGGIDIPAASAIVNPVGGAPNIEVEYTYAAQVEVQALINPAKQYEMHFAGLNEARSGKPVTVQVWKISGGLLQAMSLLGDDYGAGEVTGDVLLDGTKVGLGVSKYFKAILVS